MRQAAAAGILRGMATSQLDRIELAIASLAADVAAVRSLQQQILAKEIEVANNQQVLEAALDALNTATSQEAALQAADNALLTQIAAAQAADQPRLDTIQALINDLVNTAGIPQSIVDKATAAQTAVEALVASGTSNSSALATVQSNQTAQSARLDQLGRDPRNPVPTPPPTPGG